MGREKTYSYSVIFRYWEAIPLALQHLGTSGWAFYLLKHIFTVERFLESFLVFKVC